MNPARTWAEACFTNTYYCWLERHLQRFKYSGRYGLQPYHEQDRKRLEASLATGVAEVQDNFQYPGYYPRIEIHQHPGGVWSDSIAGFFYERGARTPRRSPGSAIATCISG